MSTADLYIQTAHRFLGGAYVFGARGENCTPENRGRYARRFPSHATIVSRCQVLSGRAAGCVGCRYNGKQIFDCRGYTEYVSRITEGVKRIMGAGATSQWNDETNWTAKGTLDELPAFPCILFSEDKNRKDVMAHTGIYDGAGNVLQCGGFGGTGVHKGALRRQHWTHWAIPVGFDAAGLKIERNFSKIEVIEGKRLMRGADVLALQNALQKMGYFIGDKGADGIYGKMSRAAVEAWQKAQGTTADGVVTKGVFDAILAAAEAPAATPPSVPLFRVVLFGLTAEEKDTLLLQFGHRAKTDEG